RFFITIKYHFLIPIFHFSHIYRPPDPVSALTDRYFHVASENCLQSAASLEWQASQLPSEPLSCSTPPSPAFPAWNWFPRPPRWRNWSASRASLAAACS